MNIKNRQQPKKKDDSSVIQVISAYFSFWPLFLILMILSLSAAYVYLRYATPMYGASAKIIIKDDKRGSDDPKLIAAIDPLNTTKLIENEIEVLQSRILMTEVVKKLHLYAPVMQEGKLNSISAYVYSPIRVEAYNPDSIRYFEKITLQYFPKDSTVVLNNSYKGSVNQWLNTPYGKLRFVHNEKYSPGQNSKPFYFSLLSPKSTAGRMVGYLNISATSKLSTVIDLSYTDEVPRRAEDILNELVTAYREAALREKNTLAKNTLTFIDERLALVRQDLDSIERKLQQYKTGSNAVDISRQSQMYLDGMSSTDKRLTDLKIQGDVLSQLEKAANSSSTDGFISSSLGINDPGLAQQISKLSDLEQQREKLKATVAENHPNLIALNEQINQLKPGIVSTIRSQRQSIEESKGNLYASTGSFSGMLSAIPQKEKQLVEITRDHDIKNGIYSFLLQKREETEMSSASNIVESRILSYAQSTSVPVSPKKLMIFLMAIAFALACPIAFITAREILSPKILYRNEIESLTSIPVIGEIAYNKSKDLLVTGTGKRTVGAEEFRKLRVSLLSLGISDHRKKILITSSISGEGKSFISANLATSIALTGKKVVLVDLDLHNPGLSKYFSISEQLGVSDYLIGEKKLSEIIYKLPGQENLYYISSGTLQPDSSELLENGKIQKLINALDDEFDVVLIDTAPIVLITDAYLLSSLCDTTLYVVRHKFTPKMLVKRLEDNAAVNPINNPAIIFNGVKTRGFVKNNYGYGYNNYVYSYETKKKK